MEVRLIEGGFSNCYLIRGEIDLVVDIGSSKVVKRIRGLISSDTRVLLLSTHFHIDHVGGISYFLREFPKAEVAFYYKVEDLFSKKEKMELFSLKDWFAGFLPVHLRQNRHFPSLLEIWRDDKVGIPLPFLRGRAEVKYKVNHWLKEGSLPHTDFKLIYSPGHTRDSICLWHEKERALFSGDTILNMKGGGELNTFCSDYSKIRESFHYLRKNLSVENLYPGHGRPILGASKDLLSKIRF